MALTASLVATSFTTARSVLSGSVVEVRSKTTTANGIKASSRDLAALTIVGDEGAVTSGVRMLTSEMAQPDRGSQIQVSGRDALVTETTADQTGATYLIAYRLVNGHTVET